MKKILLFALLAVASIVRATATLTLTAPAEGETVPLLSEEQKSYLDTPRTERVLHFADPSFRKTMRSWGYYPQKVRLAWDWKDDSEAHTKFTVQVFRKPDNVPVFLADTVSNEITLDNLEIARTYGWMVIAKNLGQVRAVAQGSFKTEDHAPRLIRIPGVPNVRDLGGRIGLDGKRVRQGMVIRTAGLNENASHLYYTEEELLENDDTGELREKIDALEAEIAPFRAMEKNPDLLNLVLAPISTKWTVFRPADADFKAAGSSRLATLRDIPETFLGAAAEEVEADENGSFSFPDEDLKNAQGPAVFMQVIEADDDGWFSIGCGADWYWDLRLDGEVVFDRMDGNNHSSKDADDWQFPVKVTKGKHLLTAVVYTGSVGWKWSCVGAPPCPRSTLVATAIKARKEKLEAETRVRKGTIFGRNRLTSSTRAYMLDVLGMKSDIDLRSDGECYGMTGSPMGPTVQWFHYSSSAYAGMQSEDGREAFTKVFKVFLDERNYPIDFHCIAGQDRTGAVAFIINGLLGVAEDDLYLDWESTGFWNGDSNFNHRNLFDHLVQGFDRWPGATINERIEAYVLDLGFTEEDIEKLRSLLLEPADLVTGK